MHFTPQVVTPAQMVELLSADSVAWMCALDSPEDLPSILAGVGGTEQQVAVIHRLCEIVGWYGADAQQRSGMSTGLAAFDVDEQAAVCAVFRRACGGNFAARDSDDQLEGALCTLAAECAGVARIPADDRWGGPWTSMRIGGAHPTALLARELIRQEAEATGWLQGTGEYEARLAFSAATTGRGGSGVQLIMAVEVLLSAAVARWKWHGPDGDDGLLTRVGEVLVDFRRLLAGRTANVPALVGLTGVDMEPGTSLTLPWGTLRPISAQERLAEGPGFGSSTAVLETQYPVKLFRDDFGSLGQSEMDQLRRAQAGPWNAARSLALACQLCANELGGSEPPRVAGTFLVVFDPSSHTPHQQWPFGGIPGAPLQVRADTIEMLERWAGIVESSVNSSIALGANRTVLASQRLDPVDAFVDTIIGWENLFGSRQGDATLRVAGSFANLLSTSATEATALFRQARELYGLRSEVVHGSRELDPEEAQASFRQSFDLLLRAFRRIFTDRQDILKMDSGQRSQRLLIRGDENLLATDEASA